MSEDQFKNTHLKKSAARLYAVQALFQMEASKSSVRDIMKEFEMHRIGAKIDDNTYNNADIIMFRDILNKVVKKKRSRVWSSQLY